MIVISEFIDIVNVSVNENSENINISIEEINNVVNLTVDETNENVILSIQEFTENINLTVNEVTENVNIFIEELNENFLIEVSEIGIQGMQGVEGIQGTQGIQGIQGVPGVVEENDLQVIILAEKPNASYVYSNGLLTQINYANTTEYNSNVKNLNYTDGILLSLTHSFTYDLQNWQVTYVYNYTLGNLVSKTTTITKN